MGRLTKEEIYNLINNRSEFYEVVDGVLQLKKNLTPESQYKLDFIRENQKLGRKVEIIETQLSTGAKLSQLVAYDKKPLTDKERSIIREYQRTLAARVRKMKYHGFDKDLIHNKIRQELVTPAIDRNDLVFSKPLLIIL